MGFDSKTEKEETSYKAAWKWLSGKKVDISERVQPSLLEGDSSSFSYEIIK